MLKRYDRAYFDHWYRRQPVHVPGEIRRKVSLAVSTCEYFLRRPVRTVLDIGCGEGAWLPHLRALRPRVTYLGLDPSDYAVKRYGGKRNIRKASFGELPSLALGQHYDLIICSDVLHYVRDEEIDAGIKTIGKLAGGLAFIEVLTADEDIVGDLNGLIRRSAAWYRRRLQSARLEAVGPYCWLASDLLPDTAVLEVPSRPRLRKS